MRSTEVGRSKCEINNRPNAVKYMRIDRTSLSRDTNLIFAQDMKNTVKTGVAKFGCERGNRDRRGISRR